MGLGAGSGSTQSPTQVSGFTNAVAVSAGNSHSLVLKSDGSVWSFGSNQYGQLGDGTTTDRTTPVQVTGLTGVIAVAAARYNSYALQTDGAGGGIVWAWGDNQFGQLGDGSTLTRSTPVRVSNLPSITALGVGFNSLFAAVLAGNGQVWTWGRNDFGQVGNDSLVDALTPVAAPTIGTARMVTSGLDYAIAIDATALGWAWGKGADAAGLGNRSMPQVRVPERSDYSDVIGVAGGDVHTLALKPNGGVLVSGQNSGRYGNGSTYLNRGPLDHSQFHAGRQHMAVG